MKFQFGNTIIEAKSWSECFEVVLNLESVAKLEDEAEKAMKLKGVVLLANTSDT